MQGSPASGSDAGTCPLPVSPLFKANKKLATSDPQQLKIWLAAVAKQDRQAFRLLYEATAPKLFGYALRILTKREIAEEALQESFVSIWNNAVGYHASLAAPMTWMTTIVRNKAFDILRRTDHPVEIDADSYKEGGMQEMMEAMESSGPNPSDMLQLSQNAAALANCFVRLDGLHRQAIAMAFYHDLSHSEVAEQMHLPIGTIKTWIRRGLEKLRLCLGKLEGA
ncbi:MAG: sigma-70 family RNA polymerase sigma factor [Proteobacteria bacterium]|nr:sigma-70 family RNA polymerase sigma factor [Pseudomonadota bacterium]